MSLAAASLLNRIVVWWSRSLPNDKNGFNKEYNEVIAKVTGFSDPLQTFALYQDLLSCKHPTCNFFPGDSHFPIWATPEDSRVRTFSAYIFL